MVTVGITVAAVAVGAGVFYINKKSNRYDLKEQAGSKNLILGFSENSLELTKTMALDLLKKEGNFLWVVDTTSFGSNFTDVAHNIPKEHRERVKILELFDERGIGFNFIEDYGDKNQDTFTKVLDLLDIKFGEVDEYSLESADIMLTQQDIVAYKEMVIRSLEIAIQRGRAERKEQTLVDVKDMLVRGISEFKTPYFAKIHDLVISRFTKLVNDPTFSIFCRTGKTVMGRANIIRRHDLFKKSIILDLDLTSDKQRDIIQILVIYLSDSVTKSRTYNKAIYGVFLNHYNVYKTDMIDKITADIRGNFFKNNVGIIIATEDLKGMASFANGADHVYIVDNSWNDSLEKNEYLINKSIVDSSENAKLRKGKLRYLNNTTKQEGEFFDLPKLGFGLKIK